MDGKTIERVFGMACITVSYAIAASQGYNGMLFTGVVAALGSIVVGGLGYSAGMRRGAAVPPE